MKLEMSAVEILAFAVVIFAVAITCFMLIQLFKKTTLTAEQVKSLEKAVKVTKMGLMEYGV